MSGAVINVVLNILLIPPMGVNGAALATFVSYLVVFIMRAVTSRKYIKIGFQPIRMALNLAVSGVQCYMMIAEVKLWQLWVPAMFVVLFVLNLKPLLSAVRTILRRRPAAE